MMFLYAIGAIFNPLMAALLMGTFGPSSMFVMISVAHLVLIIFGILRTAIRPTVSHRTPYTYEPRTSFLIGRLLRRNRVK